MPFPVAHPNINPANAGASAHNQFRKALKKAIARLDPAGFHQGLAKLADKLLEAALDGQSWALQEVANRLDGKPAQTVQLSNGSTSYVVMIPVQPSDANEWERQANVIQHDATIAVSTDSAVPVLAEPPAGTEPDPEGR